MADEPVKSEGYDLLERAWFESIDALLEIVTFNEDAARRVEAADVLLRYVSGFNTGLHEPFVPEVRPKYEESEESDDD